MSIRPTQTDLLQWAVQNSAPRDGEAATATGESVTADRNREPIDPQWLEVILGRSDAIRMRECVQTISDDSLSVEDRETAFDELEELVESLDNANDLRPLNLWTPITAILTNSPHDKLRVYAAWVLGTAVQNNPKSQKDFLDLNLLPSLLKTLTTDPSPEVRAKCIYCLSGCLSYPDLYSAFVERDGFSALSSVLRDGDETLLRKGLFVWRVLLEGCEPGNGAERCEGVEREGVVGMVVDVLESCLAAGAGAEEEETGKWDLVDLGIRLLAAYVERCEGGVFGEGDREKVKRVLESIDQCKEAEGLVEMSALEKVRKGLAQG